MAGAIAFNLVMALFPLALLGIGLTGYVLTGMSDPTQAVVDLIGGMLPTAGDADVRGMVEGLTQGLLERRTGYTVFGSIVLLWIATRLSGSVRVAVREIFDIGAKRNPVHGKLFDIVAVVLGISLLTLNLGVTVVVAGALDVGVTFLGLGGATVSLADRIVGFAIAFSSIWVLVLLAYRFMPARPIPWRTAMVAASFTAFAHEGLKWSFSWYATEVAHYGSTLGNLATVAVLFFWIYYDSLVFILGGEVAQVYMMRRASRLDVATFENGT